jgi:hypothetical protein
MSEGGMILAFSCYHFYLSRKFEFRFDFWVSLSLLWFTPFYRDFPHKKIGDSTGDDLHFGVLDDFSLSLLSIFLSFCVACCLTTFIFLFI